MTDASVTEKAAAAAKDVADDVSGAATAMADDANKAASAAAKDVAASTLEVEKNVEKKAEKAADTVADTARGAKDKAVEAVESDTPAAPPARSLDEIESDLDATRARLASRLDELQEYVAPKNVARRQLDKVKGVFVDEYGGIKPDRVLMAAGVVVAIVGLGVLRRRRRG